MTKAKIAIVADNSAECAGHVVVIDVRIPGGFARGGVTDRAFRVTRECSDHFGLIGCESEDLDPTTKELRSMFLGVAPFPPASLSFAIGWRNRRGVFGRFRGLALATNGTRLRGRACTEPECFDREFLQACAANLGGSYRETARSTRLGDLPLRTSALRARVVAMQDLIAVSPGEHGPTIHGLGPKCAEYGVGS
jgi:hypothetical protein